MKLDKYWKSLNRAERVKFLARATCSNSMICQIISGAKTPSVYACVAIEKASNGDVRCETLNPKIPWRYLQNRRRGGRVESHDGV